MSYGCLETAKNDLSELNRESKTRTCKVNHAHASVRARMVTP